MLQGLVPELLAELRALLWFHPRECLAGRLPVIFPREFGDDLVVAGHGLFLGDVVIGRSPLVAGSEVPEFLPPVV